MELKLSIPDGQQNPSIEVYKLALRRLENAIANRCIESHASSPPDGINVLCSRCAVVGERLKEACEDANAATEGMNYGGSARDASGNLYLGTLPEIFAQDNCSLCCLITRQFLRTKRREIYENARSKNKELNGQTLIELLGLAYSESGEGGEWIIDPFSQVLQLSLNAILSDGILSIWWPENTVDEVNDEPTQLPMMAADHEAIFSEVKPWIPLPRGILDSKRDLSMFSTRFDSCLQNHGKCRETSTGLGLGVGPSRLIDIEQMRIIRMGIDEIPTYFVLSYVWGHPPFLLLEKHNEREFSTPGSLSRQRIPQTIFDSIETTRRFGIRYLWVDALCIVQDDLENKMHEIDRMHIIYAQAEMTIVAATGDGANSGLLDMDPVFTDKEIHLIGGNRFTVDPMEMRQVVEFSTWFTRGWTFQELVFSRRVLYFTPERTYYACEEGNWSEDFPFAGKIDEDENENENENGFFDESLKVGFDFQQKLNPFENYSSMVSKMSTRKFTQESDCLNACRGFYTGLLLKGLGGSVCGLPAICFDYALAWQPDGNLSRRRSQDSDKEKEKEKENFNFPSWSWAAWNGEIDYPFMSGPEKCEVRCEIRWAAFEAYEVTTCLTGGELKPKDSVEYRYKQVIPTIKVHTSPEQSYQSLSSWHSHSYFPEEQEFRNTEIGRVFDIEPEVTRSGRKIMSSNFVGPSILMFDTSSAICQMKEISRPPLARHRDLRFFSISVNGNMIGELKIDTATLNTFLDSHPNSHSTTSSPSDSDSDSYSIIIELISLFELDFATTSIQDLLWMNTYSSRGTFSKEFLEMVNANGRMDKKMKAVMWITQDREDMEEGIAKRVAVGWVMVEGWESAGPLRKEVLLG